MKFEYLKSFGAMAFFWGSPRFARPSRAHLPRLPLCGHPRRCSGPRTRQRPRPRSAVHALDNGPISNLPPAMVDAGPSGQTRCERIISGSECGRTTICRATTSSRRRSAMADFHCRRPTAGFSSICRPEPTISLLSACHSSAPRRRCSNLSGPVPGGLVKLQAGKNTSIMIGALPTLIGAEYTFTFENINIERGLLWNQENAVNRASR